MTPKEKHAHPELAEAELDGLTSLNYEDIESMSWDAFERYVAMRHDGQSHNIAFMLATKSFPGAKTDSIFNWGKFSGFKENGCHKKELHYRTEAEKKGYSTTGKWYCGSLARYAGDPEAFIDSRSDVLRICKKNNYTILDGYVQYKGHQSAPKPDIEVAPALIAREVNEVMATHPGAKREDVYERIYNLRTGKVNPNAPRVKTPTEDW